MKGHMTSRLLCVMVAVLAVGCASISDIGRGAVSRC